MLVKVQAIAKGVPGCTPYFDSSDTIISNGLDMSVIFIYLILIYKRLTVHSQTQIGVIV